VHRFDAFQSSPGTVKGAVTIGQPSSLFGESVVLLNNIIQKLALAQMNSPRQYSFSFKSIDRCRVGRILILCFANNRSGSKLLCRNAFISVMKTTELWNSDNLSNLQHLSRERTLLAEAQVGSRFVVVAEIRRQCSLEMASVQDDVVVQTLPSNRAD
jgi:hypothetical protein